MRILIPILTLVGDLTGWLVAIALWTASESRNTDRWLYFAVICLASCAGALIAAKSSKPSLSGRGTVLLLLFVSAGALVGWFLGPASSASFESRIRHLFSNPVFAFGPTNAAIGAFIGSVVFFGLPSARTMLNAANDSSHSDTPKDRANKSLNRSGG